ncbi:unnamed protein product [Rhizopus microsporus]
MEGKRAAPTKRITEEIKRKCKPSDKCKINEINNISITRSKRRVHSVVKCESCGTVWNCDVNSALNIHCTFVYKSKHDNESPPPFKRLMMLPVFNALSHNGSAFPNASMAFYTF